MQPLKIQRSHLGFNSFLASDKSYRSYFEDHFSVIDKQNAKGLEIIESKTKQLKQKLQREREMVKKFKKICEEQVKKFQQLQKVSQLAINQKSRQLDLLSIQNTQLKEERIELQAVKQEKQLLTTKYEQLEKQKIKLSEQLIAIKQKYDQLKIDYDQKSQLLQSGIQQNKIETTQKTSNFVVGSMREVQQLNNVLQQQKKKQIQQAIKKQQEKLKSKSLQINAILSTFLQSASINISTNASKDKNNQSKNQIKKEYDNLGQLTEELKRKSDEISRVIVNSHKLSMTLRQRETEILRLCLNLKDVEQKIKQKNDQIQTLKSSLQTIDQQEKLKVKTEEVNKENLKVNYEQFQQNLTELIKAKTLQQYKNFYDLIIITSSQIFSTFKSSLNESDKTGEMFIYNVMKIIDQNLIKLNDFFKQNLEKQNDKIHKMTQYMARAKMIAERHNQQEQQQDLEERNVLSQSTPDRFNFKPAYQHQRQQSQSSVKSEKKRSILLEHDMDSAVNYDEFMDQLKQEALQQQLTDLKNSQVILDSLKEGEGEEQAGNDGLSDSISRSQVSNLSQAQQIRGHNEKKKTMILNAKLKKKKKH